MPILYVFSRENLGILDRVVFVGDSAHSVHPIAGQGWNLGIRDIHSLFKVLKEGKELGLELSKLFFENVLFINYRRYFS